ncbi:MAG: primosomal protein N' [Clostridiales bacterium]|nr:primosomal protein N' [Clostridiales bacterium]
MQTTQTYANVIVDISLEKLDKTFQYLVPQGLIGKVAVGTQVDVPFGKRTLTGYVVELTDEPEIEPERIKPIAKLTEGSVPIESQLIALAAWMKKNYGSTMNQALKTVIPVHRTARQALKKTIALAVSEEKAREKLALFESKHYTAKARIMLALIESGEIDHGVATRELGMTAAALRKMEQDGLISIAARQDYRNPAQHLARGGPLKKLNENQQRIVDEVAADWDAGRRGTYLLHGVTGSGKTEVYMELIARVIESGRQAIVLIPEIALTYQTVARFYNRFGERVSIMNSRLSAGERYDQFLRAKSGDIDIMIGPRSALFTPFDRLGLIVVDEEHETSYKSGQAPRYHAREVAIERARMCGASVVLGSATPSVDSYYQARLGNYKLLELSERVENRPMPECEVVDMRRELREGNRSILSTRLQELIDERLARGEQAMLFLNRRGIAGFVSCRSCGYVIKCPHCDVSMGQHGGGRMICHYCGYEERQPRVCPKCGSKYLGGFNAGTQKVEQIVQERFPNAHTMRMDADTTRAKSSYENILQAFSNHEADILIGTQMIVKGHDFPNVTLVGVLAADMSLHVGDFHAAERTFQLLTQATGRAGRGESPGQAVIQTYSPDHFAVLAAKAQDYGAFYEREIAYRKLMSYPPVFHMLVVHCMGKSQDSVREASRYVANWLKKKISESAARVMLIGPADASIARVNDVHRRLVYMKAADYGTLVWLKDGLERDRRENNRFLNVMIQFDFNPASGF